MLRSSLLVLSLLCVSVMILATQGAQTPGFPPVTKEMLANPSPDDWLMFSRTYDAQRFSPLKQITKQNVSQLHVAWQRPMGAGQTETIPLVHDGVMYVINPGAVVQALNAGTGEV